MDKLLSLMPSSSEEGCIDAAVLLKGLVPGQQANLRSQ